MIILNKKQDSDDILDLNSSVVPSTKVQSHPNGMKGNLRTVEFIKSVAHKEKSNAIVRSTAEQIITAYKCRSHNHIDEARAIGDFVKRQVKYLFDPHGVEMLISPSTLISRIPKKLAYGDCDDMALLTATLLLSIGLEPYLCCIKDDPRRKHFTHIYCCVYTNNYHQKKQRLVIDCIIKDKPIGYEAKYAYKAEYKV